MGVTSDSSVSPRAEPGCSLIFMDPADPQVFWFPQPLALGFSVNGQGPTCPNVPCPELPMALRLSITPCPEDHPIPDTAIPYPLHTVSYAPVPNPTLMLLPYPRGHSLGSGRVTLYTLAHLLRVTTLAAKL